MLSTKKQPLMPCSREDFNDLLTCMWAFPSCSVSGHDHILLKCKNQDCSFQRIGELDAFYKFYRRLCSSYKVSGEDSREFAISSHHDLLDLIELLRNHPDISKEQFTQTCLANHAAGAPLVSCKERDRGIDLAVRLLTMINAQQHDPSNDILEFQTSDHRWLNDMSLSHFVENSLPPPVRRNPTNCNAADDGELLIQSTVTADHVMKKAKLKFKPTDDLSRHLKIDRKLRIVEIFHHAAFLKENLRLTRGQDHEVPGSEQLKSGAIPRQVALEVLDSIQKVLFRYSSASSRAILRSLISKERFDPECLNFEASALRLPEEEDVKYDYFGSRLAELYEEIIHPSPNGSIEKWMEKKSGARYVMMTTLIGVAFAILLGILSLIVSCYQAYISYQAWQHPRGL